MTSNLIIPVILCGGSGTRLQDGNSTPKQFRRLPSGRSLLQETIIRAVNVAHAQPENIVTVTLESMADEVRKQCDEIDPRLSGHILREPAARNTAAAIAFAANYVSNVFGGEAIMWVLPSDHYIGNERELGIALASALESAAEKNFLVTFGIRPAYPEAGYGYIRPGNTFLGKTVRRVLSFTEKPDVKTAEALIAQGYLWNSGMFLFKPSVALAEYRMHAPDILFEIDEPGLYPEIRKAPFDRAILEKSSRIAVISCDPDWADIGTPEKFESLQRNLRRA